MSHRRPEHAAPPEVYYGVDEARKYAQSSRMIEIQTQMSERAYELLDLPEGVPCNILDLGCGSGLSGQVLEEHGHNWIGLDISKAMLDVTNEKDLSGDLLLSDLGQGLTFRPGSFDAAISISAIQWLCNADKTSHRPAKRLFTFFTALYSVLCRGGRAVFQFYPENPSQQDLITSQAKRAGFGGGMVIDFPDSKRAKKMFLILWCGGVNQTLPKALTKQYADAVSDEEDDESIITEAKFSKDRSKWSERHTKPKNHRGKPLKKSREWILEKKERNKRRGREVRESSKYTGRKRSSKF